MLPITEHDKFLTNANLNGLKILCVCVCHKLSLYVLYTFAKFDSERLYCTKNEDNVTVSRMIEHYVSWQTSERFGAIFRSDNGNGNFTRACKIVSESKSKTFTENGTINSNGKNSTLENDLVGMQNDGSNLKMTFELILIEYEIFLGNMNMNELNSTCKFACMLE